ncbi:MAG TPA: lysylphosphatidylglycerol synthase transmembrane domain-containing protein [Chitinophagaceae bacterium]|nr:lysylphosphatidylglycerol synthase transmembrane domain-containing protein [Chitinophagaceae bacterium]
MNKRIRTIFTYLFFLGLGIFLVWWSIKDLTADDKSQIKAALKTARYWLVLPVFIMLFGSHLVRALRWKLLIEPMGYKPSTANTFFAVMIGYLANQAVPRLGEVLKCTVLARYEKVPADKLIGTIILERVIDAVCLLTVFGITLAIQPDIYAQLIDTIFNSSAKNGETKHIPKYIIGLALLGLLALIIASWMIRKKKNFSDLWMVFKKIGSSIWQGLSAIQHLKRRGYFITLTLILWTLYLTAGYIGFFALQQTTGYGFREAFTVLSAGSIGMIATPGGIGAYAYLIQKTMQVYGLNEGIALAFGWILWLAQTTVILLGGLVSFAAIPYFNKHKKHSETA